MIRLPLLRCGNVEITYSYIEMMHCIGCVSAPKAIHGCLCILRMVVLSRKS